MLLRYPGKLFAHDHQNAGRVEIHQSAREEAEYFDDREFTHRWGGSGFLSQGAPDAQGKPSMDEQNAGDMGSRHLLYRLCCASC